MQRTLWLQYERPPHADAVIYPASEEDVKLALAALRLPYAERCRLAVCLRNWLLEAERADVFDRPAVAVRFGEGLYQPVPWRFAKWLSCVLHMGETRAEATSARLRSWLEKEPESVIANAE